mmetsp:Transcript_18404/g.33120  ORF Transcript_18404/g.33120 Transcript_18404/m.33120 type:complete len:424 (-) Transcript_18404:641-1912(-)
MQLQTSRQISYTDAERLEEGSDFNISGRLANVTQLSGIADLSCRVTEFEITKSKLFGKQHVNYFITTLPFNWHVKRSYSDFLWLRGVLAKLYPGYAIPMLPSKSDRKEHEMIQQKVSLINGFLHTVTELKTLCGSTALECFLKCGEESTFKKVKKQISKAKGPKSADEFVSINGQLLCSPRVDRKFLEALQGYCEQSSYLQGLLKSQAHALSATFTSAGAQLKTMAETSAQLAALQQSMFSGTLGGLYESLHEVTHAWANEQEETAKRIRNDFEDCLTSSQMRLSALQDLLKQHCVSLHNYLKANDALLAKKQKLWELANPQKWKLDAEDSLIDPKRFLSDKDFAYAKMLPKPTAQVQNLRLIFSFFNAQLRSEGQRLLVGNNRQTLSRFIQICEHNSSAALSVEKFWSASAERVKGLVACLT